MKKTIITLLSGKVIEIERGGTSIDLNHKGYVKVAYRKEDIPRPGRMPILGQEIRVEYYPISTIEKITQEL